MNLTFEKLKKEDLKEAISIYDENHNTTTDYEKLNKVYENIYNNPNCYNFVAKLDEEIVGLATIIINYDIVEEVKPFLTIWNFGIKKEYRRQGIGTKMFAYIEEFAKQNEYELICLLTEPNNEEAQAFYDSLNFYKIAGYVKNIKR